jgi:hypothetical protein
MNDEMADNPSAIESGNFLKPINEARKYPIGNKTNTLWLVESALG